VDLSFDYHQPEPLGGKFFLPILTFLKPCLTRGSQACKCFSVLPPSHPRKPAKKVLKDWTVASHAFPELDEKCFLYRWLIVNTQTFYWTVPGIISYLYQMIVWLLTPLLITSIMPVKDAR
jgi:hypothetical protein